MNYAKDEHGVVYIMHWIIHSLKTYIHTSRSTVQGVADDQGELHNLIIKTITCFAPFNLPVAAYRVGRPFGAHCGRMEIADLERSLL